MNFLLLCHTFTLDGGLLEVISTVDVTLERKDGPVSLPTTNVTAYLAGSLRVVNTDVLVGNGVVIHSGGLHLQYCNGGSLVAVTFG